MNTVETTAATPEQVAKATIRLEFPHGVANLTIRADESMSDAYRGEFYGPKPTVIHADGVISIDYPRFNPFMGRTSATVTGQLIPRIKHYHYLGTIGVALMMVGIYLLAQTTAASTQMSVTIDIVMVGLGLGVTMPLYINAVQSALPQRYLGVGTSQIQFWRNVGGTVSSAVLGSILAATARSHRFRNRQAPSSRGVYRRIREVGRQSEPVARSGADRRDQGEAADAARATLRPGDARGSQCVGTDAPRPVPDRDRLVGDCADRHLVHARCAAAVAPTAAAGGHR